MQMLARTLALVRALVLVLVPALVSTPVVGVAAVVRWLQGSA